MIDFATYKIGSVKEFTGYVYNFYSSMVANKVKLVYEGEITHQITKAFTALAESQMIQEEESYNTQKKVFHIIVECLQNITKHADSFDLEQTKQGGSGLFVLIKNADNYTITAGNIIKNVNITTLKNLLETINATDKEGLKELYKTQIREGRMSEKGGAGLGLIDIARKSGNQLEYYFIDINTDFSFFIINSKISRDL